MPDGDGGLQVAVGRRDEPDVGRRGSRPRRPARTAAPAGSGAAWAGAASGRSPISSRKSVPPSAAATLPAASRDRPGEGPAGVAEQVALQQLGAQARAAHRDERRRRPAGSRRGSPAPGPPCRSRSRPGSGRRRRSAATRRALLEHRAGPAGRRCPATTSGTSPRDLLLQVGHPVLQAPDPLDALEDRADLGRA